MKRNASLRQSRCRLKLGWRVSVALITALSMSQNALAQSAQTTTSPIETSVTVTATVGSSCAFWLDQTSMSLGSYEGSAIVLENATNFRCSVLPAGSNNNPSIFTPICIDAGLYFRPQTNADDPLSPRSMLLQGGDEANDDHRLNYNIFNDFHGGLPPTATSAWGTGGTAQSPVEAARCALAAPGVATHPGQTIGHNVGPGGLEDEVPNTTYRKKMYIYVYPSTDQPGTPVTGTYSDTVNVYFIFKEP